ncbi:MAG: hypothetical protein ACM31C_25790 [Acidobacteriota bacterium]
MVGVAALHRSLIRNQPADPRSTAINQSAPRTPAVPQATCSLTDIAKAYKEQNDKNKDGYVHAMDKAATATDCKKAMDDLVAAGKDRNCPLE